MWFGKLFKYNHFQVQQSGTSIGDRIRNVDPAWDAIEARAKYLEYTFKQTFEQYASKDSSGQESVLFI